MLDRLEAWLAGLYKGSPKLGAGAKKSLVNFAPWVALVFGILQLLGGLALWNWGHKVNDLANTVNNYYGSTVVGNTVQLNVFYWVTLAVIIADAVILLMAFPKLRAHSKAGWNLLFYGTLLNFVYGVVSVFNNYGGISSLIWQTIVTGLVLYFLFQIRDSYHASKS